MKINVKKTKAVCISRQGGQNVTILIEWRKVEQPSHFSSMDQMLMLSVKVNNFKYLGSVISEDGYCAVRKMSDAEEQGK